MPNDKDKMQEFVDRMSNMNTAIDEVLDYVKENNNGGDNGSDTMHGDEHLSRSEGGAGARSVDGGSDHTESSGE